jgi:predicted aspartyl protease
MRVQAKQRVYLKGTLNGKSVVFLVDSGAESTFVASSAVKRLG